MNAKKILVFVVVFLLILISTGFLYFQHLKNNPTDPYKQSFFPNSLCTATLTRDILDDSLEVGTQFLLNNQKPEGNFNYEYNFVTQEFTASDSQVRQAGALWGLSLLYQNQPNMTIFQGLENSIAFFQHHSILNSQGLRWIFYPDDLNGNSGTVALVCLALIDFLRSAEHGTVEYVNDVSSQLDEYLSFLVTLRRDDGQFYQYYNSTTGNGYGDPSPYFDGESLLALTKAAKYLNKTEYQSLLVDSAQQMYTVNVEQALETDPDSSTTKGFFQWSCMAYFELATSGWENTEHYGNWVISLADWMIDIHKTLDRTRNTAYAYEGIIHAFELARLVNDQEHMEKFACVIDEGLYKLTSWQVGSPIVNEYLQSHLTNDSFALGGVMNHKEEAPLRIDVTQHQMHAVILARKYVYTSYYFT